MEGIVPLGGYGTRQHEGNSEEVDSLPRNSHDLLQCLERACRNTDELFVLFSDRPDI